MDPAMVQKDPAGELETLLNCILPLVKEHIASGHESRIIEPTVLSEKSDEGHKVLEPREHAQSLGFQLMDQPGGLDGLLKMVDLLLNRSINTWDQKFMHKLSSSTNPVGIIAEMLLGVLNANVVVFETSPVLTTIEKTTAKTLASMYGFNGPYAGGICQPGGSTSNLVAVITARNTIFPDFINKGFANGKRPVMFTSSSAHFSFQRAAMIAGIGAEQVCQVPVDEHGRMKPDDLKKLVVQKRAEQFTPFFVNATAGTTVYGAFDPFKEISLICREEKMWMHIDGSWGGSVVFSKNQKWRLDGCNLADSITMNPHKMLGAPLTCSFFLTNDVSRLHEANRIRADYLFHSADAALRNPDAASEDTDLEVWDIADLTLQCGRRGDALKMALGWVYYGAEGYAQRVDSGYEMATWTAALVNDNPDLLLTSPNPPSCLQVCFYYAAGKKLAIPDVNSQRTVAIQQELKKAGFSVDYSLGENGYFFRAVIHPNVSQAVIRNLLDLIVLQGKALDSQLV